MAVTKDKTKISAYVTKALQQQLKLKADEMGLSTSQLLGRIVSEYLGGDQFDDLPSSLSVLERFEAIETRLTILEKQACKESSSGLVMPDSVREEPKVVSIVQRELDLPAEIQALPAELRDEGLSARGLSRRFGSSSGSVSLAAKKPEDEFMKWCRSKDPNGIAWRRDENHPARHFFPVS